MEIPAPRPEDSPADTSAEGQWLTLADLGRARGISKASAARLVRRHKWRRQAGNDGRVRVLVPPDALEDSPADSPQVSPADMSRAISAFEAAIAASGERAQADAAMLATLQVLLDEAKSRCDRAEARADALTDLVDMLKAETERVRQAEAERRARGRLARLRAAWRGE